MDVDAIMDVANVAVEDVFGRHVRYVPPGGGRAVEIVGDFQLAPKAVGLDDAEFSTHDPRVDFRKSHLSVVGVTIEQNGLLSFELGGEAQTYRVLDVQQSATGSVVAVLGRKSS